MTATKNYPWISVARVRAAAREAKARGVSSRATGPGQFVEQYSRAGGQAGLSDHWWHKRNAFVARHLAQAKRGRERLYVAGEGYSRRGLALLVWAYDPKGKRLLRRSHQSTARAAAPATRRPVDEEGLLATCPEPPGYRMNPSNFGSSKRCSP